jgi:hypothetical protein
MHERELEDVVPEGLGDALQRLAEADAELSAPPRVEAALIAAFRERRRKPGVIRMRPQVGVWAAAAAAAVVALVAVRISFVQPPEPGPAELQEEVATPFYPLVPGFDPDAAAYQPAVRIEMPRTALAAYGLPVNVERIEVPIQADLLIGEDGTARAIRFVSTAAH